MKRIRFKYIWETSYGSVLGLSLKGVVYFHLFFVAGGNTGSLSVIKSFGVVFFDAMVVALESEVVEESHLSLLVH